MRPFALVVLLASLGVVIAGYTCHVGATGGAHSPRAFASVQSPQTVPVTPGGTITIKEIYDDDLTVDGTTLVGTVDYGVTAALKGTLVLTNHNGSAVTADTQFMITAGTYSLKFRVGDDPKFNSKSKKSGYTNAAISVDFGGKSKNVKALLSLSWTKDKLTYSIVTAGQKANQVPPVFGTLRQQSDLAPLTAIPVSITFGPDSASFIATGKATYSDVNADYFDSNGVSHTALIADYTAGAKH